ncbi:hypothetical protein [Streptomyces sp. ALI-76-A]|nr:hypothetical protein [Streptomyces sp. ALI-76-A]MDL5205559.1 hypothetical protein [Streptomyces sp. ALI-76-A]
MLGAPRPHAGIGRLSDGTALLHPDGVRRAAPVVRGRPHTVAAPVGLG